MTKTKFSIMNPLTGMYVHATTELERDALMAQFAWEFFLSHTHDAPYSIITIAEDGSETWASPNGAPIMSQAHFEICAKEWIDSQESELTSKIN